jgi:hypothetical protein
MRFSHTKYRANLQLRKIKRSVLLKAPRRYPYFDVVVGLAWSYDTESYAGGSVAAGRVSHAGQVKVMIQTKRDTLALYTAR